jgi:dolichol-phosphate mannosyltransferase
MSGDSVELAAGGTKALVIVPTYNERENVERLCNAILAQGKWIEVLVVDDNSPDGTAVMVERMGERDARVNLLSRPGKMGLGTAHIAGFRWALERDYDRIITMDADFSHPPDRIPAMLAASLKSEVVIGSRYVEGGGHKDWPARRIFLSSMSNLVARLALQLEAADCTGAFRCFRREVLDQIAFDNIVARGYSFQEEMLWHCTGRGWRIAEVPIVFVDRERGESKISLKEIWGGISTVFRLMFTPRGRRIPSMTG